MGPVAPEAPVAPEGPSGPEGPAKPVGLPTHSPDSLITSPTSAIDTELGWIPSPQTSRACIEPGLNVTGNRGLISASGPT